MPEALLQNPGAEPTPAERAALLQRESPLLRSGVALAGFNKRQEGSDAGVLTALEAAGLDLYGTRLVVLSTCDSGLGEASTGEGVYGMRRALAMAGAETQVMSLWEVDTGRTRELMEAYYRAAQGGRGAERSDARRAARDAGRFEDGEPQPVGELHRLGRVALAGRRVALARGGQVEPGGARVCVRAGGRGAVRVRRLGGGRARAGGKVEARSAGSAHPSSKSFNVADDRRSDVTYRGSCADE